LAWFLRYFDGDDAGNVCRVRVVIGHCVPLVIHGYQSRAYYFRIFFPQHPNLVLQSLVRRLQVRSDKDQLRLFNDNRVRNRGRRGGPFSLLQLQQPGAVSAQSLQNARTVLAHFRISIVIGIRLRQFGLRCR